MPFKDAEAKQKYMKEYLAKYRQGRRVGEEKAGKVVSERTLRSRAKAEATRKRLWRLEHKDWDAAQQRERRRLAREGQTAALLHGLETGSLAEAEAVPVPRPVKKAGQTKRGSRGRAGRGEGGLSDAPGRGAGAGRERISTKKTTTQNKKP